MYRFSEDGWPIVTIHAEGKTSLQDFAEYAERWEKSDVEERFLDPLLQDEHDPLLPGRQKTSSWLFIA